MQRVAHGPEPSLTPSSIFVAKSSFPPIGCAREALGNAFNRMMIRPATRTLEPDEVTDELPTDGKMPYGMFWCFAI